MQITAINPAFVMGPPLDNRLASSLLIVKRLMKGTDPLLARIGFTLVDVRDIALMHLRALERPESIGQRFIGAERFLWFDALGKRLKAAHPQRRIATRTAPDLLIRVLARFDPALKPVLGMLGKADPISASAATRVLGVTFRDAGAAFEAAARHMDEHGLV
jgi:dihydroflavonol-4-reductase